MSDPLVRVEVEYQGDVVVEPVWVTADWLTMGQERQSLAHWSTQSVGSASCQQRNEQQTACLSQFLLAEHASFAAWNLAYATNVVKGSLLASAWQYLPRPDADFVHFSLNDASISVTRVWLSDDNAAFSPRSLLSCQHKANSFCLWPLRGDAFQALLAEAGQSIPVDSGRSWTLHLEHCALNTTPIFALEYKTIALGPAAMRTPTTHVRDIGFVLQHMAGCTTVIPLRLVHAAMRLDSSEPKVLPPIDFAVPKRRPPSSPRLTFSERHHGEL